MLEIPNLSGKVFIGALTILLIAIFYKGYVSYVFYFVLFKIASFLTKYTYVKI